MAVPRNIEVRNGGNATVPPGLGGVLETGAARYPFGAAEAPGDGDPWPVCAETGYLRAARAMLIGLASYLRPGELVNLTRQQLIPPSRGGMANCWSRVLHPRELELPSKTGQFNDSLLLDGPQAHLMGLAATALKADRVPSESVLGFSLGEYTYQFQVAVKSLGVQPLHPVPYQLRHTGASRDLVQYHKPLIEVKRRGCWQSDKSLNRYLKGGRTAEQFDALSRPVQARCLTCQENTVRILKLA